MADHGARAHDDWSASASERNFACPGALALIASLGIEDRETEAAAWGTACHQVAEKCFRENRDAASFIGSVEKTKTFSFTFDDEMAECTQVFLDYVRGRLDKYESIRQRHLASGGLFPARLATMLIEQKFDLAPIDPPLRAGGTGDVVLLFPAWGLIEVVDLKTGRKWVDAVGNKQTRTYALGAAIVNRGDWSTVRSTIVQPRAGSEAVRWEEISIPDLLDWTVDLKAAMAECDRALHGAGLRGLDFADDKGWCDTYLRPGDHCRDTFCPAAGRCPAIESRAMALARVHFQPVGGAVSEPPDPKSLPHDKVVAVLDAADMLEAWLNGVRQYAREIVEGGGTLPTPDGEEYHLVDKAGRRAWIEMSDDDLPRAIHRAAKLHVDEMFDEPKLKSPAQMTAAIRAKHGVTEAAAKAMIADLCPAKSSGQNLVRSNKTSRAKALAPVNKFFQAITE